MIAGSTIIIDFELRDADGSLLTSPATLYGTVHKVIERDIEAVVLFYFAAPLHDVKPGLYRTVINTAAIPLPAGEYTAKLNVPAGVGFVTVFEPFTLEDAALTS